jgi:sec-independent protein translocase protein TatC
MTMPPATPQVTSTGILPMPVTAHLAELRHRLLISLGVTLVFSAAAFGLAPTLITYLTWLAPKATVFVQLSPGEVLFSSIKISIFCGVGLALPVILYHVVRFTTPGLTQREKDWVMPLLILAPLLFGLGALFAYRVLLPLTLTLLLDYGQTVAQNHLSIAAFVNFCSGFLLMCGLAFELPLFLLVMAWMGMLSSGQLLAQWKVALSGCFLLGAIATPGPDVFSQVVMTLALAGLYGVSIVLIRLFGK